MCAHSQLRRVRVRLHFIWGIGFLCALIPTAAGSFARSSEGWCFIKDSPTGHAFRWLFYYLWLLLAFFASSYFYWRVLPPVLAMCVR